MSDSAGMLTVEIGFRIKFDKRAHLQEKLRSKQFIFMQKARMEPQIAQNFTTKNISTSRSSKIVFLEEFCTRTFSKDRPLATFLLFRAHLEENKVGRFRPQLFENELVDRRHKIVIGINKLNIKALSMIQPSIPSHRKACLFLPNIMKTFSSCKGRRHLAPIIHHNYLRLICRETKCLNTLYTSLEKGFRLIMISDDKRYERLHNKCKDTKKVKNEK